MDAKAKYLVVNGGSSSLKFSLYEMPGETELVNGYIEKIGLEDCFWTLKQNGEKIENSRFLKNHKEAVVVMMQELVDHGIINDVAEIKGVGHRVLHGGEFYADSMLIDDEVLHNIIDLTKLGPLHHPGQIAGIQAMREYLPATPQIAVFDTAFHQTMPQYNYLYPVPYEWYEKYSVRRYGFHGTSHKFITGIMQEQLHKQQVNLIICHLGSGASIAMIKDGKCCNTTMGLTPLDGLMMGTRCGGIDPSILKYVSHSANLDVDQITDILNKKSGLLGIAGKSDLRDIETLVDAGDERAQLAFDMILNSVIKYIAQYYFELNAAVDAIVMTAGIGENSIDLRKAIVNRLAKPMHIALDETA
ncbi:MAG: acetate kinase, partial [Clostridiales bacterium]